METFYNIEKLPSGRYQYGADGTVIGEAKTIIEAVEAIEELQKIEQGWEDVSNDAGDAEY